MSGVRADVGAHVEADVVVLGAGAAGLTAALAAHRRGADVVVLAKPGATATARAQGGIAVVAPDGPNRSHYDGQDEVAGDDRLETHVADTLTAGAGLCDAGAVASIVADGPRALRALVGEGARFDRTPERRFALGREGGHSRRRIVHAGGDATGAEVQRALAAAITTSGAGLDVRHGHAALRILRDAERVTGVLVAGPDGLTVVHAPAVIMATGGLGQVYRATTNPDGATGDGIALALWAGVAVADLEFVQFHPTMLAAGPPGGSRPLITEALRGEGAVLRDAAGDPVLRGVHPLGDLAPRDVVAAAVHARLRPGAPCVYLDTRGVRDVARRFPTVTAACRAVGIDPARTPIPVVPGAHYACGGVVTDTHGRTELPGLYAAGEVGRTGMHGANRLASNSLLEALVVGGRAGTAAAGHALTHRRTHAADAEPLDVVALPRAEVRDAMSAHAFVRRDAVGLARLAALLDCAAPVRADNGPVLADAALTQVAATIAHAAAARTETRGTHHRDDHPATDPLRAEPAALRLDPAGRLTPVGERPVVAAGAR